MKTT